MTWEAPKQPPVYNTTERPLSPELAYLGPMTHDQALAAWEAATKAAADAKRAEMDARLAYVAIAKIEQPLTEGTNTVVLGGGYSAKVGIKYNYKLDSDHKKLNAALDRFARVSNEGAFIADRLVKWSADMSVAEYRKLVEASEGSDQKAANDAKKMLALLSEVLTVTEATPTLEIKEPKGKKK